MRRSIGASWVILMIVLLGLTACSGLSETSTGQATAKPTATVSHAKATPTVSPTSSAVYLGAGSTVYALDAHTGALRWKYDTNQPTTGGFLATLFAEDGLVFFNDGYDSSFYALDATTGALHWKTPVIGFASSLVVFMGVVYITSTTVQAPAETYAINAQSGAILWQMAGGGAMVVNSDAAYFANTQPGSDAAPITDGFVRAYNRMTGALLWQIDGHPFSTLQVSGGMVYTTADNMFYAYDALSGDPQWTATFTSAIMADQLVGTTLYLSDATQITALDVATHTDLWQFAIAYGEIAVNNNIACLANQSNFYGVNATSGVQLWSVQNPTGYASLTYGNGLCFADSFSADRAPLSAVDTATGVLRWSRNIQFIYGDMQTTSDAIYVIANTSAESNAPQLTALSDSDGSTLWTFAPPTSVPGQFTLG